MSGSHPTAGLAGLVPYQKGEVSLCLQVFVTSSLTLRTAQTAVMRSGFPEAKIQVRLGEPRPKNLREVHHWEPDNLTRGTP